MSKLKITKAAAAVLGAVVGLGVGAAGVSSTQAVADTTHTSAPEACREALRDTDTILGITSESMGFASDGFFAIANGDPRALSRATEGMEANAPRLRHAIDAYKVARAHCLDEGV